MSTRRISTIVLAALSIIGVLAVAADGGTIAYQVPAGFQGTIVAANYGAAELNGNSGSPSWTTTP